MVLFEPTITKAGIECYHLVHKLSDSEIIHIAMGNKLRKKFLLQKGKKVRYLRVVLQN